MQSTAEATSFSQDARELFEIFREAIQSYSGRVNFAREYGDEDEENDEELFLYASREYILADDLRSALLATEKLEDPRTLTLTGVKVIGDIDLNNATLSRKLIFEDVESRGNIHFLGLSIPGLAFSECILGSVRLEGSDIGELRFEGCRSIDSIDTEQAQFGSVLIRGCGIRSHSPIGDHSLSLRATNIRGSFTIAESRFEYSILAPKACVGGDVDIFRSVFYPQQPARADEPATVLSLGGATVGGTTRIMDCEIPGLLNLRSMHQMDDLYLGALLIGTAEMRGDIFLSGAEFGSATVTGTTIYGSVVGVGLRINGKADLRGLSLLGGRQNALGPAGEVNLQNSYHAGGLNMEGVTTSRFDLSGAVVSGDLNLSAVDGPAVKSPITLSLRGAQVGGDVLLAGRRIRPTSGHRGLSAPASIDGTRAVLNGTVDLSQIQHPEEETSISFIESKIGALRIGNLATATSSVGVQLDLTRSQIDFLDTPDVESGACLPSIAMTAQMRVGAIGGFVETGPKAVRDWRTTTMRRSPRDAGTAFRMQPWFAIADSYESSGRSSEARRIRYEAFDVHLKQQKRFSTRVWRLVTKIAIGHGYYSGRALVGIAILWAVAGLLVWGNAESFTPSDQEVAIVKAVDPLASDEVTTAASSPAPPGYPGLWAPLYAVDVVLSPIGTGQSEAWRNSADPLLGAGITGIKLAAWALLGLFITGVSGVVKKN